MDESGANGAPNVVVLAMSGRELDAAAAVTGRFSMSPSAYGPSVNADSRAVVAIGANGFGIDVVNA